MKAIKISYWITTGLLSALYLMSAGMYLFNHEMVVQTFNGLGFPVFIIYPLAFLKISGVIVLLTQKQTKIKEWVYAGITFNALLAAGAHLNAGDGEAAGAFVALVLMTASYILGRKHFAKA